MTSQTNARDRALDAAIETASQDLAALNRASDSVLTQLRIACVAQLRAIPAWLKLLLATAIAVAIPVCIVHA